MTPLEFLQKYFEIEPERMVTDPYYAIYDLMVEGLTFKEFTYQFEDIMERYSKCKLIENGKNYDE
jgi:hypothetical protein